MTREEAIERLNKIWIRDALQEDYDALHMAIMALEHPERNVVAVVPCGDTVSRQAVIQAMYDLCDTGETLKENIWRDNPHIDAIIDTIENLPSVTPKQRTGHWVEIGDEPYDTWECDNCGFVIDGSGCVDPEEYRDIYKYCPNCGAKMEGESE